MAATDQHEQMEQLLDLFVYAPIGLLATGLESLPDLAAKGRASTSSARVVGQFATTMATKQVRDRLSEFERQLADVLTIVRDASTPRRSNSTTSASTSAASTPATAEASPIDVVIEGYDSMPASAIVPLLAGLDADGLAVVESHELAGRARRTVLNRISQRRASLGR